MYKTLLVKLWLEANETLKKIFHQTQQAGATESQRKSFTKYKKTPLNSRKTNG